MRKVFFKNILPSLLCFALVYSFLLFLNAIFPTQSDDIGRKLEGIQRAINSYMTWNGRIGELMLVTFGSYLSTTLFYAPLNSFIGASVVMLIFVNIFGRFPQKSAKDISCFAVFFLFIMFDKVFCFGSVFYWAAGCFNYLWAWFFILIVITPINLFWRKIEFSKKQTIAITMLSIPIGIVAGWSSEFGIVFIVLWIASIIFAKNKKIKLPLWYYTSLVFFIAGWCILYASPGMRLRSKHFSNYLSIIDLIKLGPLGLTKRIFQTFNNFNGLFYYQNFCLLSLFLLLSSLLYKPSLKKFESTVLAIFLMMFCIRSMPKLFFIFCALFICIMSAVTSRKENIFLSNLFIAGSGIYIATILFIGATIQIGIPRRAAFQYNLLNIGLIAINMIFCFERFADNKKITKIATTCCISFTLLFSIFVGTECLHMNRKWKSMENTITEQKAKGINNVIIDESTFRSRYWNYGDWGNPGTDSSVWPNTTYANYYGVESLVAK